MPEPDWKPIPGFVGRANVKLGVAYVHVMHQVPKAGTFQDQYDQPELVEGPGAVVLVTTGDRVGFIQNFRMTGQRPLVVFNTESKKYELYYLQPDALPRHLELDAASLGQKYVERLLETGLMPEVVGNLGQLGWELPAGLAAGAGAKDLKTFILNVAKAEASEEGGFDIADDIDILPTVNFNPTYFAHAQHVVIARMVGRGNNRPEERESIGRIRLFTREEIDRAAKEGWFEDVVFEDGKTLSVLRRAGY